MQVEEEKLSPEDQEEEWVKFVGTLAHELKTPLTTIIAAAGLLAEEFEDSEEESYRKLIQNIMHNASALEERVVELLEVLKAGGGRLRLQVEPIDARSLLQGVGWQVGTVIQRKGQSLSVNLPDSLPLVQGDGQRLEQVVLHLITNASKFTPEGGEITLRARKMDTELVIAVQDNGVGIAWEAQAKVFKPYTRIDADRQLHPGLGLGLALAKQVVELHGGRIWVESEVGRGSTFSFSLPLSAGKGVTNSRERL